MRDVAKAAGVSPMTVSRALKSDGTVNEKTRTLVQETATRLGYVYDATAQTFRAQRSGFVAFTLPSVNNANFATTHKALTDALAGTDLQLLLGITDYDIQQEERMVRQLLARRPDAVILTGGTHTPETRRLLETISTPVFEVWDIPSDPVEHVIGFSNHDAMEQIVAHLAQSGRRKLGFVGASMTTDSRGNERRLGVIDAARKLGLPKITEIDTGPAPATMSKSASAVSERLDVIRNLDALVCVSDPVAFGAIRALEDNGMSVPANLAVTGFGNFEISQMSRPSITTLEVGAAEIGGRIGAAVAELLSTEFTDDTPIFSTIPPNLLTRQSSART